MPTTDEIPTDELPTEEQIADALAWVRDEYENNYPEWVRFSADADRLRQEAGFGTARFQLPEIHMPIVRWRSYEASDLIREVSDTSADMKMYHLRVLIGLYRQAQA